MNCPRCAGLIIREEVQVHSGRFHGWRCVQCGLWLDQTIAKNRIEAPAAGEDPDTIQDEPSQRVRLGRPSRTKRTAGRT